MDILEIFRRAIKGGRGPEDEAYTAQRRESMRPIMNYFGEPKQLASYGPYGADGPMAPAQIDAINKRNLAGFEIDPGADAGPGVDPTFAQRQYPGREGIAAQFAPQGARPMGFPGVDDMQHHRGTGYTVPDAARRDIMGGYDAGRDYGYEGPGQYPADVVNRVLIEEQMRRRNRTMPGSPVNY